MRGKKKDRITSDIVLKIVKNSNECKTICVTILVKLGTPKLDSLCYRISYFSLIRIPTSAMVYAKAYNQTL